MMEVTSCGELERQTPEGDTGHPLGDLCAKLRHWPKPGSQGEQVKPTWLHSSSLNIATTMWFGECLDCGLCVVQHHVRQRSVREKPSPSWHTPTHIPHIYIHTLTLTHIHVHLHTAHTHTCTLTHSTLYTYVQHTHTCTLTHSTHTYMYTYAQHTHLQIHVSMHCITMTHHRDYQVHDLRGSSHSIQYTCMHTRMHTHTHKHTHTTHSHMHKQTTHTRSVTQDLPLSLNLFQTHSTVQ